MWVRKRLRIVAAIQGTEGKRDKGKTKETEDTLSPPPFDPSPADTTSRNRSSREFAVLVPLLSRAGRECVLLTKRPDSLKRYAGHVSLPGGAREPEDQDLWQTALRETYEEVGIPREAVELVGELRWFQTSLGDRVKPYIGHVRGCEPVVADSDEVERLLYLPTDQMTHDLFRFQSTWTDPDGERHAVYSFEVDGCLVWGLTARILYEAFVKT